MKNRFATLLTCATAAAGISLGALVLDRTSGNVAEASPVLSDPDIIADVAEKVTPSVVNVSTTTELQAGPAMGDPFFNFFEEQPRRPREGKSLGSGVIVGSGGLVLTNNHVVANARTIQVTTSDGRDFAADVVGADPKSDLAVLRLKGKPTGLVPLRFGDSSKLRLGEIVLAVGNPLALGHSVSMGIVSAKGRANVGIAAYEDFIQTDAAINPGNSGGALVNLRGELVGINTAIASRSGGYEGIGFSIPSDMIAPIMKSLVDKGRVVRGWMGIGIQDVNPELAASLDLPDPHGVVVTEVVDGSPAAKAGLRRGDVIVSVAGKQTWRSGNLRNAIAAAHGRTIPVEYFRRKEKKVVQVAVVEQPEEPAIARGGRGGEASPASSGGFGAQVSALTPAVRKKYGVGRDIDRGVVISAVASGGLADAIGLQPGDVILEVNREPVSAPKDLETAFKKAPRRLALLVNRGGQSVYLSISK
jgi:serine protease Do